MPASRRVGADPNVLVSAAITPSGATAYVSELTRRGELWDDSPDPPGVSPDRDDDYLIALARAAEADAVISGDTDLTGLDLPDLPVLVPRRLLESHATEGDPGPPPT